MKPIRFILLIAGLIFVAIQFIRPSRNKTGLMPDTDITKVVNLPDSVQHILKKACWDCHSDNTRYPWYFNVQPVGWLLSRHIKEGKSNLNFSEFVTYGPRQQMSKLDEIIDALSDNIMPLPSYKFMHKDARLGKSEVTQLINWAENAEDSISGKK